MRKPLSCGQAAGFTTFMIIIILSGRFTPTLFLSSGAISELWLKDELKTAPHLKNQCLVLLTNITVYKSHLQYNDMFRGCFKFRHL